LSNSFKPNQDEIDRKIRDPSLVSSDVEQERELDES